jgi:hypothetical protein
VKIEKAKFDDLLGKMIKSKPLPEEKSKGSEETEPTSNIRLPHF